MNSWEKSSLTFIYDTLKAYRDDQQMTRDIIKMMLVSARSEEIKKEVQRFQDTCDSENFDTALKNLYSILY